MTVIFDCISDLHGHYPKLEGGDLLIVAGDLTASDIITQYLRFFEWLYKQKYKKKILIFGNHDNQPISQFDLPENTEYLCDSGTQFEGFKIWGSPWTLEFPGMNPKCKAFTVETEKELGEKWDLIPDHIDILITHSPPYGYHDQVNDYYSGTIRCTGSRSLLKKVKKIKPKLHVFGHIHEGYGKMPLKLDDTYTLIVNASHVNEDYKPINKPIRVVF